MDDTAQEDFLVFVHRSKADLLGTAYLLSGDPHQAEELVREAYARVYAQWGKAKSAPWPAARTALVNLPVDHKRSPDSTDGLMAALDTLPARERQGVVLHCYVGLSDVEIARVLDVSVRTAERATASGLATLAADPREPEFEAAVRTFVPPAMSVDADDVIRTGQRKVSHRRTAIGWVSAAVALAVGAALVAASPWSHTNQATPVVPSPVTTTQQTQGNSDGLFAVVAPDTGAGGRLVEIFEKDGVVRFGTWANGHRTDVTPQIVFPDGGSAGLVGTTSVAVHPVVGRVRAVIDQPLGPRSQVVALPSGPSVIALWNPGDKQPEQLRTVLWADQNGTIRANTAHDPAQMPLSAQVPGTLSFFSSPETKICGLLQLADADGPSSGTAPFGNDGRCEVTTGINPSSMPSTSINGIWALQVPGPVSAPVATPVGGQAHTTLQQTAVPGTSDVLLWAVVHSGDELRPFARINWTSRGKTQHWLAVRH